mgnify:CR=1 FL=1
MKTVTFTEFRNNAAEYFDRVEQKGETVEIYRHGKPAAVLTPIRGAARRTWRPAPPMSIDAFSLSAAILKEREDSKR